MDRPTYQNGVPPLHTATRPPQRNPTVTGPQSRCGCTCRCNPDADVRAQFNLGSIDPISNSDVLTDGSTISSNSDDVIEQYDSYSFYPLPLLEEQEEVEESFILVVPYRRDGQPSLSAFLDGDQINPWIAGPPFPPYESYDDADADIGYDDIAGSMSAGMNSSKILDPYESVANGGSGSWMGSMSMTCSSLSSSRMTWSGWSGSASIYLKHAGSHLNEMTRDHGDAYPDAIDI
ncbi:hypothetical protein AJ79_03853 [Helicocarpus griseus UAMH5409]|uniref:Uncharacterized protein n=1 Tax=Helicocarpus griseus UAMH5409 TaxID=1447875 RepID=A0A2B7XVA8_9EURO|nr:hypothetical protein AJ79_03853 [Helicocarpus griseus UAMH5409]